MSESAIEDSLPIVPFVQPPYGRVNIPGSKSITNRALILAALGSNAVVLEGALFSRDTRIMIDCLRRLGFIVRDDTATDTIAIQGASGQIPASTAELYVGNAGTAARFLTAMLCLARGGVYQLDGDPAMRARPMEGLLRALCAAGAEITFRDSEWHFPFVLKAHGLRGGKLRVDASASSQILSALLMVAPHAVEPLEIVLDGKTVSEPFVEMTRKMVATFNELDACLRSNPGIGKPVYYRIEPDATAASYFMALPIVAGGSVALPKIAAKCGSDDASLQGDIAFLDMLRATGLVEATVCDNQTLHLSAGRKRDAVNANFNAFSDTFLTLAAISPVLVGETSIHGIEHTRHQETDRIAAMASELRKLGQYIREEPDAIHIKPSIPNMRTAVLDAGRPLTISTYEDHRIAMSFGILGSYDLFNDGQPWLQIENPNCCGKTFPTFFQELEKLRTRSEPERQSVT